MQTLSQRMVRPSFIVLVAAATAACARDDPLP